MSSSTTFLPGEQFVLRRVTSGEGTSGGNIRRGNHWGATLLLSRKARPNRESDPGLIRDRDVLQNFLTLTNKKEVSTWTV